MSKDLGKDLSNDKEKEKEKELTKEELKAKKENEKKSKKAMEEKKPKKSFKKFLKDTRSEFKKVAWPKRQAVFSKTMVVLTALIICSIGIWAFDSVFLWTFRTLFNFN